MTASPGFKGSDSSSPGARPFLKWAGGKTQLLSAIEPRLPPGLADGSITRYVEPFVGSGAVFFAVNQRFPLKECYLYDINEELVLVYQVVKRDVSALIEHATVLADEYAAAAETERRDLFYRVRERFNRERATVDHAVYGDAWVERAAQLLFLNKTCFNGLFRVNSRGEFNAPFGKYRKTPDLQRARPRGRLADAGEHRDPAGRERVLRGGGRRADVRLPRPAVPPPERDLVLHLVREGRLLRPRPDPVGPALRGAG